MNPLWWPYLATGCLFYTLGAAPLGGVLRLVGRRQEGLSQRMGFYPASLALEAETGDRLWMQAVSLGEVHLAVALLKELAQAKPKLGLVLSTSTRAGYQEATKLAGGLAKVIYFPLDTLASVRRAFKAVRPELIVLLETELWPLFLDTAYVSGVKVVLANGRVSDRTAGVYRLLAPAFRPLLARISRAAAVSQRDADRLRHLGVPPDRLVVIGNAKSESLTARADPGTAFRLGRELRLTGRPVWVAGSIRSGEIKMVIEAHKQVRTANPEAVLVIAPRHLKRVKKLSQSLKQADLAFERRSRLNRPLSPQTQVLILDTMGELFDFYASAKVALTGGSLIPLGGQNPLEPAHWGVPVLFGPHMDDFQEAADKLLAGGGAREVHHVADLAQAVTDLLTDEEAAGRMGALAQAACQRQGGAIKKTVDLVIQTLDQKG